MTTKILRLTASGLLVLVVAACGGGSAGTDDESDGAIAQPVASTAAETAADPNDPEAVGAIVYEEEVPVPGTTLDACEIVTADDVKAAFMVDGTVAAGTFEADPSVLSPGHSECTYQGDFGRLIVALTPEDGANLYDAAYGAYDGLEVITGLGDGAFWSAENRRGFVWQDRVTAMFTIQPSDGEMTGLELTETLGQMMLGKLQ
jgi:hypothetical protein